MKEITIQEVNSHNRTSKIEKPISDFLKALASNPSYKGKAFEVSISEMVNSSEPVSIARGYTSKLKKLTGIQKIGAGEIEAETGKLLSIKVGF